MYFGNSYINLSISINFIEKSLGITSTHAYIQSPSDLRSLRFLFNLVKSFTSKDPQGMYPPLFSLNNLLDVPPLELIHKRCTLSCSQSQQSK
ncbi:hypothetical protein HKD37_10G028838 [Glycine soja]